jgi:hypothetical protein
VKCFSCANTGGLTSKRPAIGDKAHAPSWGFCSIGTGQESEIRTAGGATETGDVKEWHGLTTSPCAAVVLSEVRCRGFGRPAGRCPGDASSNLASHLRGNYFYAISSQERRGNRKETYAAGFFFVGFGRSLIFL